jgi:hypothetical protein
LLIIPEVRRKCPTEGGADVTSICFGMAEMLRAAITSGMSYLEENDPKCNTSQKIML